MLPRLCGCVGRRGDQLGTRVQWLGDCRVRLGKSAGLSYGVREGRGNMEVFRAADHLRGTCRVVRVLPDSHDNF